MGCGPSKSDIKVICQSTGMSKKDVNYAFKEFKKDAGGAKVQLDKFTKLVSNLKTDTGGNAAEYARQLFRVLDEDKDNKVTFREVFMAFHHLSGNGDEAEKMRIVFKMYDVDCTNTLSPSNVKTITKAQYQLQGKQIDDKEIDERVKHCFDKCDLNSDGKITEGEFLKAGVSMAELFELEE